ncbi:MAG: transposase [Anaerolineae bacterium]|nr:transposase [Anaerolineae bacterium]
MEVIAEVKLITNPIEREALFALLRCVNHLRNTISVFAFDQACYNKFGLQNLLYHDLKPAYLMLASNHLIRSLATVAANYKTEMQKRRVVAPLWYRENASIELDRDLWRFKQDGTISLSVAKGQRLCFAFQYGDHQAERLDYATQSAKLVTRQGIFYLQIVCDIPEAEQQPVEEFLGVDLGIVKVAVDSDGQEYNAEIDAIRERRQAHRSRLQQRGTKSAKRRLKKVAGKQARFQRDTNHVISKRLVEKAKDTQRGIGLEQLTGIRNRTEKRLRKSQRARHTNWSFHQLQTFITYKAQIAGIPVVMVDPRYTSQTCAVCGHIDSASRRSQSVFRCTECGHEDNADRNAAINISKAALSRSLL